MIGQSYDFKNSTTYTNNKNVDTSTINISNQYRNKSVRNKSYSIFPSELNKRHESLFFEKTLDFKNQSHFASLREKKTLNNL